MRSMSELISALISQNKSHRVRIGFLLRARKSINKESPEMEWANGESGCLRLKDVKRLLEHERGIIKSNDVILRILRLQRTPKKPVPVTLDDSFTLSF